VDTTGCDCGADGKGEAWHELTCSWFRVLYGPPNPPWRRSLVADVWHWLFRRQR
jgi:hypothetical protein